MTQSLKDYQTRSREFVEALSPTGRVAFGLECAVQLKREFDDVVLAGTTPEAAELLKMVVSELSDAVARRKLPEPSRCQHPINAIMAFGPYDETAKAELEPEAVDY